MIQDFLRAVAGEKGIAIPGLNAEAGIFDPICKHLPIDLHFLGTVLVCARPHVEQLAREIKAAVRKGIGRNSTLGFEVNYWADAEKISTLPIRWYSARGGPAGMDLFGNYSLPDFDPAEFAAWTPKTITRPTRQV